MLTGLEIAVIGMAGRFPGAGNLGDFWNNLKNGIESIHFFSDEELEAAGVDRELRDDPRYVKADGQMDGVEYFDAPFFEYTHWEARVLDPQIRLFHQCTYHALEDAGYNPETYKGLIGLYAGAGPNLEWEIRSFLSGIDGAAQEFAAVQLNDKDYLAARVSYRLNLRGPSFSLNTACSTSLVAIHLACQALLGGECDIALAGGVKVAFPRRYGYIYQEHLVSSPDGHCRAFDAAAQGAVGGEGVGVVVLKRLEDAAADRDRILALIKGSAINNDGKSKVGFTAPSIKGQAAVIKAAHKMAEVQPESISYMEAHGTATPLGDPVEVAAMKLAFGSDKRGFCAVGSVKTNIGHTDAAAGAAGFIKTVLALRHRKIPPSLHFETPNPKIDFENSPFYVVSQLTEWRPDPAAFPQTAASFRAGVSSFGIGGTNAHVILEEAPRDAAPAKSTEVFAGVPEARKDKSSLLLLSAATPTALDKMSENLAEFLKENPGVDPADAAYTLHVGRKAMKQRRMLICSQVDEAVKALFSPGSAPVRTASVQRENRPVVFMFPGLGSQYAGMAQGLYSEVPFFREEMERCFEISKNLGVDIKEILYPPAAAEQEPAKEGTAHSASHGSSSGAHGSSSSAHQAELIDRPGMAQPVIFAVEYALAKLLLSWGIEPYALIGYSFGEYAAACIAGVFSLEEALELIVTRGRLIEKLSPGAMLSVPLSKEELLPLLDDELFIAIDNGPTCVVSGETAVVEKFAAHMKKKKYLCLRVPASHALHSPLMEPIAAEYREKISRFKLKRPRLPFISNVSGGWMTNEDAVDPAYWVKHLQQTVRFADGVQELVKEPDALFIEVGPGRDLSAMMMRHVENNPGQDVFDMIRHPQKNTGDYPFLADRVGRLWLSGVDIDWDAFHAGEQRSRVGLPLYPFEKIPYWFEGDTVGLIRRLLSSLLSGDAGVKGLLQDEKLSAMLEQHMSKPLHEAAESGADIQPGSFLQSPTRLNSTYEAPATPLEETLSKLWQGIFLLPRIGVEDDFFELGGDSLKAIGAAAAIHRELDVRIPLEEFFKTPTIRGLARCIEAAGAESFTAIPAAEKQGSYLLSSAQERLYVLHRMTPDMVVYNLPAVVVLQGSLDKERLESTFRKLIVRHESLRTSFFLDGEIARQRVHNPEEIEFKIEFEENPKLQNTNYKQITNNKSQMKREKGTGKKINKKIINKSFDQTFSSPRRGQPIRGFRVTEKRIAHEKFWESRTLFQKGFGRRRQSNFMVKRKGDRQKDSFPHHSSLIIHNSVLKFIRPFDLSCAPLLRVGLIEVGETEHILMLDMHHIISDGVSIAVFSREFMTLYAGQELPLLGIQYKDYALWQRSALQQELMEKQEDYWLERFAGEIPVLELPTDYPRPTVQDFAGAVVYFQVGPQETAGLKKIAREQEVTLYMVLLALFNVFLAKISGAGDIIVGTPTAGRRHADLEPLIGMFVNTLGIRSYPRSRETFAAFLQEVKTGTLAAFENQEYQFEDLIEKLSVNRDTGRNPLFDVMFVLQNVDAAAVEIPGLTLSPYEYENRTAKFDLTLQAFEIEAGLKFSLEYATALFEAGTIERFISYFRELASAVIAAPGAEIALLNVIPAAEKRRILFDFNDVNSDYPADKTIARVFADQVERTPHRTALVGPSADPVQFPMETAISLTYRQLERCAEDLSRRLAARGVGPDVIVGLLVERSIERIAAILGILKAGGAYLPIDPGCPAPRKSFMLRDSAAGLLLTTRSQSKEVDRLGDWPGEVFFLDAPVEAKVGAGTEAAGISSPVPDSANMSYTSDRSDSSSLAYVIYTSGTTGEPKGSLTTQANVLRLVKNTKYIDLTPTDRLLQLSNYVFDGSVFDIFGTLLSGSALVLAGPGDASVVDRLAALIERQRISVFLITTALFNTLVELRIECLAGVRKVLFGGERVSVEHTGKALEYMGRGRILHVYGPTETTVFASSYPVDFIDDAAITVPIGGPTANMSLYILDRDLQPVPIGTAGEIYIGGSVARGYLNRPELTAEKFIQFNGSNGAAHPLSKLLAGQPSSNPHDQLPITTHSSPFTLYKSGDLGRWLPDGSIEFLERIDKQVKLRGFRIELGEIESRLIKHENIKETVVTAKERNGETYLCAYIVTQNAGSSARTGEQEAGLAADSGEVPSIPGWREYLSNRLPEYMVPAYFVELDRMPLTANGKIDLKALPEPGTVPDRDYAAPGNELEKKLAAIWAEVLNIEPGDSGQPVVGIDHNFFHFGGHSLKATILSSRIHRELNVEIPLAEIFRAPTIRELSRYIAGAAETPFFAIEKAAVKPFYPVSSAQKRLYIMQQLQAASTAYNLPNILLLTGILDKEQLAGTFEKLIARHESLRTSFHMESGEPEQKIHPPEEIEFQVEYYDAAEFEKRDHKSKITNSSRTGDYEISKSGAGSMGMQESPHDSSFIVHNSVLRFVRPFDLSQAPLLRVGLIRLPGTGAPTHIFMVDMHHIISDGTSLSVFIKEFMALQAGQELPLPGLQYKDFSEWQNHRRETGLLKAQEEYWAARFAELPQFSLPYDFPVPKEPGTAGNAVDFQLNEAATAALKNLVREEDVTLFMALLAIYNILLSRVSGEEDIPVGTPVVGRRHADLQETIGMFVNTVVLRNFPMGKQEFSLFLRELKENTIAAFENQDFLFEDLIEIAASDSPQGGNPLFEAVFSMQNIDVPMIEIPGLKLSPYPVPVSMAKFNMMLVCKDEGGIIYFSIEYRKNLFKEETVKRFIRYFKEILAAVTKNKHVKIEDIKISHRLQSTKAKKQEFDFNF
ncbi:MAG: amino acid adenylation domain-containing protein [Candidatus Aminicenantes bacterium]|nr:amino acid adenylation domain-containing protein [Candidatus Aminicenantes bacterium]